MRISGCWITLTLRLRTAGAEVRNQRGQWLLARVYAVLGEGARALKHAQLCYEFLEGHRADMEDLDFAFVYEAIARAYAVNGDKAEANRFIQMAQKAGEAIKGKEDRDIFFNEFNGGEWSGVK